MPPDGQMDLTADTYAMGRVLYDFLVGGSKVGVFPELPPSVLDACDNWDMDRVGAVIGQSCSSAADDRYANSDRMSEELEACRRLSFDDLFATLDRSADRQENNRHRQAAFTPIIVAAINVLPWVFGLLLAIVLAAKYV